MGKPVSGSETFPRLCRSVIGHAQTFPEASGRDPAAKHPNESYFFMQHAVLTLEMRVKPF